MAGRWNGVIARLGTPTGDGRILSPTGGSHRTLPMPLLWQQETSDGHDGAVIVGRIDDVQYGDDMVTASGLLFDSWEADQAQALLDQMVIGPSVDLADIEYAYDDQTDTALFTKWQIAGATLVPIPAFADVYIRMAAPDPYVTALDSGALNDAVYGTEYGDDAYYYDYALLAAARTAGWATMPIAAEGTAWDGAAAAARVFDWATDGDTTDWAKYGKAFLWQDPNADAATKGAYKLGIADVIDGHLEIVPAAVNAVASVLGGGRGGVDIPQDAQDTIAGTVSSIQDRIHAMPAAAAALIASVAPGVLPSVDLFRNPMLPAATPLTVTAPDAQGIRHVFGHIAPWGTCHVGLPGCVTAPQSRSEYGYFLTGVERTAEGVDVPVGRLTVGGGHASASLGFAPAMAHYDDIGTAAAAVFAGEDQHGIWVSGWILPGTPDAMVSELLRHPPSGDWRNIGGELELIAVCAVNSQGFPVKRPRVAFSNGRQNTLIGAFGTTAAASGAPSPASLAAFKLDTTGPVADASTVNDAVPTAPAPTPAATAALARWHWTQGAR